MDYLTEKEHLTATSIVLEEAGDKALVVPTLPRSIKRSIEFAEDLNSLEAEIFLAFPRHPTRLESSVTTEHFQIELKAS